MTLTRRRSAFTLLELLIVVGILAMVGTGMIVAYDGVAKTSEKGKATFDIGALDAAVRTFATVNKTHPTGYDSLLATDGTSFSALNSLPPKLQGKIGATLLTPEAAAALNAAGIDTLRYVTGDNSGPTSIPNRIFDNPTRGEGGAVAFEVNAGNVVATVDPLAAGSVSIGNNTLEVAVVENIAHASFTDGTPPADSSRLRDIAGLDESVGHFVVAFGIGNNSTLVDKVGSNQATLSEAPGYASPPRDQYSRYLALYHVASDTSANGTFEADEYLGTARFVAIVDTFGDWLDEEYAEFTGQKQ